jgi:hypothetical protein
MIPIAFLNPWLWLGALAIGAPLWLHLRRKKQTNLVRFSATRFLEDQPEPRRSPLHLRDVLLFSLRLLALLLIVSAFAWPYLKGMDTAPVKESRVYILDNTLSHQAGAGFARDREELAAQVARAGADIQVAVVELTAAPKVVVAFGDSRQIAAARLKELQPSFERGSYLAAFRQATALLENSFGERKRIVLLGDSQQNQWTENLNTPPFLRQVQVDLPKVAVPMLPNLSVCDPRAQRMFLGEKSLVNFTVRLTHSGPAQSAMVALRAEGKTIFNRTVELENQPETMLLQAQWEAEPGAWVRGEVTVAGTPDALEADNRVVFALAPVVEGKVALLAQSPHLRLALSPDIMRGQWETRTLDPTRLAAEIAAGSDADVLCLESSYLQSADARKLVGRYLSNGRGVLLLVNRTTPAIDGCLRELGFECEGIVRPGPETPERFQFVLSNHPIFHPFLSPEYGNLMEIKVSEYVRLKGAQATPLIFGEQGEVLFFQSSKSRGKLFVSAFGLDREHTTWPIHQSFIPFLDLALQAARGEDPEPTTYEPGELASLRMPESGGPREVVLRDGVQEVSRGPVEQGRTRIRMPGRPGLYSLTFDDNQSIQKVFSVNPSPKESALAFLDSPPALGVWSLISNTSAAAGVSGSSPVRLAGVLQQRWWWWMVLGGVLLLLLESAWAGTKAEAP